MNSYSYFFSKKIQHICVSLDVNFNESLTNDIVRFEQLDPDVDVQIFNATRQLSHIETAPENLDFWFGIKRLIEFIAIILSMF